MAEIRKTIKSHPYYIYLRDGTKTANRRPARFETVSDAKEYIWTHYIKGGDYTGEHELIFDIYEGDPRTCSPSRDYIESLRTGSTVFNYRVGYTGEVA